MSGALWVTDLDSGEQQRLLPDFLIEGYSVSPDGTQLAFTPVPDGGPPAIWVAALDGRSPPRRLPEVRARGALFGPDGRLYFVEDQVLYRANPDGSGKERMSGEPIRVLYDISPDGKWAAGWTPGQAVAFYPLDGGPSVELCPSCGTIGAENRGVTPPVVRWAQTGRYIYLHSAWTTRETYAVPLEEGRMLPALPPGGIRTPEDVVNLPGARRIGQLRAFPGDDPSVYVFMRATMQRNIFRVAVR